MTLLDILASAPTVAAQILERTSSTPRVQQIVQLSLAPAFLLGAIGAVMNVMMSRLIWIANRIDRINGRVEDEMAETERDELPWLGQRRRLAQWAVMFSTASAAVISVVIALLFVSAYIDARIGTTIALAWVLTMLLLITGLIAFLFETRLAARGFGPRRKRD